VALTAGETAAGIDATLQTAGAISGRLTDANTGGPIIGAEVLVFDSGGTQVSSATTDAGGGYTVSGLVTGSYDVEFVPQGTQAYISEYYSSSASGSGSATAVSVTDGQTVTGISAALQSGAVISGTVTDASSGKPVAGAYVLAQVGSNYAASAVTDSGGHYAIGGLTAGTYTVQFEAGPGESYLTQFYDNVGPTGTATPITLASGQSATEDAQLTPGGEITGTVTDAKSAAGLSGVIVNAYSTSGSYDGSATTDSSGSYTIASLATGSYDVNFQPTDNVHAAQFYDSASSFGSATAVSVTAGSPTSGINAALAIGGTITGTVTDSASGKGAGGVGISAVSQDGSSGGYATSAGDGTYTIGGLAAGNYTVTFAGGVGPGATSTGGYGTEYYDNATTIGAATPVPVVLGQPSTGINATLSGGGSISGAVDGGSSATPLSGVEVYLSGTTFATTTTASDGSYFIGGLPPGTYTATFYDPAGGYLSQSYTTAASGTSPASITVTAGATTTGVSATLVAEGTIAGSVSDATTGAGVGGIQVLAQPTAGGTDGQAVSDSNSAYTISGLAPGSYQVFYSGGDYVPAYYTGQTSPPTPTDVTVTAGQTTTLAGEPLQEAGTVTGTVTDAASGAGVAGVSVTIYDLYGDYVASGTTGSGGGYSIDGVPGGTYVVGFAGSDGAGSYVTTYYGGSTTQAGATQISVTDGKTTSGIDQALPHGGSVSGTVTDATLGTPLAGIVVDLYDSSGNVAGSATTSATGRYSVAGLPPGTYTASFAPSQKPSPYQEQYYKDQLTAGSANTFSVSADATTSGIDAALSRGGIVSGTVTAATTGAALGGITVTVY
ncbi:MAG: carboxypeptidase regulatory-like domain-containing protein, partial [Solirubrobacteraceae bacterium]